MAPKDSTDNRWQYFFTAILTVGLAMNAYLVNKVDRIDDRLNTYIERLRSVEMDNKDINNMLSDDLIMIKEHEIRLQRIEAIIPKEIEILTTKKK
jgi:hypothetical protein